MLLTLEQNDLEELRIKRWAKINYANVHLKIALDETEPKTKYVKNGR